MSLKVRVREISHRLSLAEDGDDYYTITLKIGDRNRKFSCRTHSQERAIALAYYYWTGNRVSWLTDFDNMHQAIFTEDKAEPEDFLDLEKVPPWTELPF